MPKASKSQNMESVHQTALRRFNDIQSAIRDERLQCLQDRRFYSIAGAQWEGPLEDQFENKPKFEVNKIHLSLIRIFNEYRNNRISVDFVGKSEQDDKLADICDGLYRSDERYSVADEAYDNAFEEAVAGGFGAWRLRCVDDDEYDMDSDHQRIKIEPIFDADSSVFFDLGSKRQDKSDARFCFVVSAMTREDYEEEYNDNPADWPKVVHQSEFDWSTPDVVYVAEYYVVEEVIEKVRIFHEIDGKETRYSASDFESNPDLESILSAIGSKELIDVPGKKKTFKKKKIRKYILSGNKILEDCGYIVGCNIPIVPVYGKRWFIDNIERCMGHVRLAKDAQRLKNMQLSKLGEISALSSVEKPIFIPEQIAGHQLMWSEDNIKDYPYLLVNPIQELDGSRQIAGPVSYTRSPSIPPAMAALLQITEQDMQDILGNSQNADKVVSNISGKAVELIQNRIDMQAYIYMSNFAKGMKRCGEIWLGMAKEVYTYDKRSMQTIDSEGGIGSVDLMTPNISEDGDMYFENDLSFASFDVCVDVGPSSSSKRAAVVKALTGMIAITQDPETIQILSSMAMMNMEGEGISDVRSFFRKRLVMMGVIKPNEEEIQEMQEAAIRSQSQEDPNAIFIQAAAEEASAKAAKARADTVNVISQAELNKAKTESTIVDSEIKKAQAVGMI